MENIPLSIPESPLKTITNVLTNLLSSDNNQRNNAEKELRNQMLSNLLFQINELLNILTEPNISLDIKKLSAIIIRNTLFDSPKNWSSLSYSEQSKIKLILTKMISPTTNLEIMKQSAMLLSSIAYIELTQQNQSQIKQLIEGIIKPNENPMVTSVYLYSIKLFFEQYKEIQSIDLTLIQPIMSQIISNLSSSTSIDIIVLTLELDVLILPFLKTYMINNKDNIVLPIFNIISNSKNIQITVQALLVFYEIISLYHIDMSSFSEQIFNTIINVISNSEEINITLNSMNILCLICDKETQFQTKMSKYILTISKTLATLIITVIELNTKVEIDDNWCISRACCYFLSYLVQIQLDGSLVEMLFIYVSNTFHEASETKRFISLLILSCCLESNHKDALSNLLLGSITDIWEKINDGNQILSITLSWILGKISELFPNVFERKSFHELIPTLINVITSEELNLITRINTAISLGNIIRYFGDENASHNKNSFGTYYKLFVDKFIDLACHLNHSSSDLSFYLLRIVMNVVQYSSLEYQDYLEIILARLLSHFEIISNSIIQESNHNYYSYYSELQLNLCLIIHQIFSKIIRRVDKNLCKRLYNAIIVSFQRKGPYESGMLCLFNIVIIIENDIDQFFNYLFQCFDLKDNYLLIQGTVAIISNLAWNQNTTLKQWSNKIMMSLFSLLTDENIKFDVKPLAISAIGDICYNYPLVIIDHIESIITLLFSTFEVVISTNNEDCCMLILKNSIECFSMVLFSLQETQKEQMIFMSIKQLIWYIIYFSSIERIEIKTNLISLFGDIMSLLGERIREFTNKEEVKLIQNKLQVNASDSSLKWMNSIINKIF